MLDRLHAEVDAVPLVTGFVDCNDGPGAPFRNAAAVLAKGEPMRKVYKSLLPTYDVFDEDRYFEPGTEAEPVGLAGRKCGLTICEDVWVYPFLPRAVSARSSGEPGGAGRGDHFQYFGVAVNAGKPRQRLEMLSKLAADSRRPLVYCNALGGMISWYLTEIRWCSTRGVDVCAVARIRGMRAGGGPGGGDDRAGSVG